MSMLFNREAKVRIDYFDKITNTQATGEAIWNFILDDESGLFGYGNGTCIRCNIKSIVNGKEHTEEKLYDTRYAVGITDEETFEQFCIKTVGDFYRDNAKEIWISTPTDVVDDLINLSELIEDIANFKAQESEAYDMCWNTGDYEDQYCPLCPHNSECSGYDDRD